MAAKSTLNEKNLQALGAARLAELLLEFTEGDAVAKRKLRLELAAKFEPGAVAREVKKRLAALARARSFVDWRKTRALAEDLDAQRVAIVDQVAKVDAAEACELMWRFLALAEPTYDRIDDSDGGISPVFSDACEDLGTLAAATKPDIETLTERMFTALQENGYGQYDGLIAVLAPVLGRDGLHLLKARFEDLAQAPEEKPVDDGDRQVIGWSGRGPVYEDEIRASLRRSTISMAMKDIAEALGDVDGYIAQFSQEAQKVPRVAADLANRLLAAGRPDEALQFLERVDRDRSALDAGEWKDAYIDTLEALGRHDEAQTVRWDSFCASLGKERLRDYLKRLPDFDDVEAEWRAFEIAMKYPSVHQALSFLVNWPAHDKAADLILQRADEIDGDHYYILTPAAEKLEGRHPLAATILRRAMIDFALRAARHKRYKHAAKHLLECKSAASQIDDFGKFGAHTEYVTRLKGQHGRKSGFWKHVT